jgi:molybdopterin synthase catalytic subunit
LKDKGCASNIHERAYRDQSLTRKQEAANTERSGVRVRVEHVFGHLETAMNGCYVRPIGIARAQAKIALENIAYNISRFTFLSRGSGAIPASA